MSDPLRTYADARNRLGRARAALAAFFKTLHDVATAIDYPAWTRAHAGEALVRLPGPAGNTIELMAANYPAFEALGGAIREAKEALAEATRLYQALPPEDQAATRPPLNG